MFCIAMPHKRSVSRLFRREAAFQARFGGAVLAPDEAARAAMSYLGVSDVPVPGRRRLGAHEAIRQAFEAAQPQAAVAGAASGPGIGASASGPAHRLSAAPYSAGASAGTTPTTAPDAWPRGAGAAAAAFRRPPPQTRCQAAGDEPAVGSSSREVRAARSPKPPWRDGRDGAEGARSEFRPGGVAGAALRPEIAGRSPHLAEGTRSDAWASTAAPRLPSRPSHSFTSGAAGVLLAARTEAAVETRADSFAHDAPRPHHGAEPHRPAAAPLRCSLPGRTWPVRHPGMPTFMPRGSYSAGPPASRGRAASPAAGSPACCRRTATAPDRSASTGFSGRRMRDQPRVSGVPDPAAPTTARRYRAERARDDTAPAKRRRR